MNQYEIICHRLLNQQIAETQLKTPEQVVKHLGAMQAQEYAMAKWSIGLRLQNSKDAIVEKAFHEGRILRTHLLRPTWHFVHPEDIRWMLKLTAPRVHAINAFMYRKTELDDRIFKRCHKIITKSLEGGRFLTRDAINAEFEKQKIVSDGVRLSCIMMHAELEGLICSGPREGKQFTYGLLEERVKPAKSLTHEEALHELSSRYFTSRGPATLQDFVTWSGLTVKDARKGIDSLDNTFARETWDGKTHVFIPRNIPDMKKLQTSFLMPDYDEYGMGYKDRSAIFNAKKYKEAVSRNNPVFNRMIVINGKIAGTWQRNIKGKTVEVHPFLFPGSSQNSQKTLRNITKKFEDFMR